MANTYEYYLSKGFDDKAARYFTKGRRKPVKVVPQDNYKLLITFDNNEQQVLNFSKYIKEGTVYYLLRDKNLFNRCYIDSENSICWDKDPKIDSSIIWSNKIDIGSDTCYLESE